MQNAFQSQLYSLKMNRVRKTPTPHRRSVNDNQAVCPIRTGISERAPKLSIRQSTVQLAMAESALARVFAR